MMEDLGACERKFKKLKELIDSSLLSLIETVILLLVYSSTFYQQWIKKLPRLKWELRH